MVRLAPGLVPPRQVQRSTVRPYGGEGASAAVLQLQRSAGNRAVSRLVSSAAPVVQRNFTGDPASVTCTAKPHFLSGEVEPLVVATEWRANFFLPQQTIASQADLTSYLQIWKGWGECVAAALAVAEENDATKNYRSRFDRAYLAAIKTIFLRAEQGTGTATTQLATKDNLNFLLPRLRADVEGYLRLDKADRLAPTASPEIVLNMLNPGDRLGHYCSLNCPAAAEAVQDYLQTGSLRPDDCTPIREHGLQGYAVAETSWNPQTTWPTAWSQIMSHTTSHGTFVMVEGDRVTPPANLTQWHYFMVVNIRGSRFFVDGFLHSVYPAAPDGGSYIMSLGTKKYRTSNGRIDVNPVRK
ncbi:MAG: hypothetical protein ACRDTX_06400 [Pseudonocardiaceae bacterium]